MNQKYVVQLTEEERAYLEKVISAGVGAAQTIRRAHILLKSDSSAGRAAWTYAQICDAYQVHPDTVTHIRKDFLERGLAGTLRRKPTQRAYRHRLDGHQEAHLIAVACSTPPEGQAKWSLRLLADRIVELEIVDEISHETVRQVLKKKNSNPG